MISTFGRNFLGFLGAKLSVRIEKYHELIVCEDVMWLQNNRILRYIENECERVCYMLLALLLRFNNWIFMRKGVRFNYTMSEELAYINSFDYIRDDIDSSYLQYLCQVKSEDSKLRKHSYNVISFFMLIIYYFVYRWAYQCKKTIAQIVIPYCYMTL